MLDKSICHFRGVGSILSLFLWKILLANNSDPDQMSHNVASDLGLHCMPMTHLPASSYLEWVKKKNVPHQLTSALCFDSNS